MEICILLIFNIFPYDKKFSSTKELAKIVKTVPLCYTCRDILLSFFIHVNILKPYIQQKYVKQIFRFKSNITWYMKITVHIKYANQ